MWAALFTGLFFFVLFPAVQPRHWQQPPRNRFRPGTWWAALPAWQKVFVVLGIPGMLWFVADSFLVMEVARVMYLAICALPLLWLWLFAERLDRGFAAALNYRFEPDRCGACGYRLMLEGEAGGGADASRCPECNWPVPDEPPAVEPPDWWVPWRHDELCLYDASDMLRRQLQSLGLVVILGLGVCGLALATQDSLYIGVLGIFAAMSAWNAINTIRVACYLRRVRAIQKP
jgi:hypothetical protein